MDHNVPKYAVGTEVSKRSEDGNWQSGKITEYRVTEGWYTIKYEDGDVEDYTEKELRNLLKKSAWDRHYKEIKAYKAKFGHCNVPFRRKLYEKLANWVFNQRKEYFSGKLSKERIAKLEDIGFLWEINNATWAMRYNELVAYKEKFGHCMVPRKDPSNLKLGGWVAWQRSQYKDGKLLLKERIVKLDGIGFVWRAYESHGMLCIDSNICVH